MLDASLRGPIRNRVNKTLICVLERVAGGKNGTKSVVEVYLGRRSGISATTYAITAIAAAAFETSSGMMRSTVSAGVW